MRSCIFSIIPPVFSVTWSSEIIIIYWFTALETFLIIINVEFWIQHYKYPKLNTILLLLIIIIIIILINIFIKNYLK